MKGICMEINLYDVYGSAVAYIDEDGTIYLWGGKPVAYIYDEDKIYGWNGKHLGLFSNEIVYDLEGKRVGYTEYASPRSVYGNPVKSVKRVKPTKMVRSFPKTRPIFSSKESSIRLKDFLEDGSVI